MRSPFESYSVECGEGWERLYKPLMDLCELYGLTVLQVKEKFGGLRFYYEGDRYEELMAMVDAAEARSYHTCEDCGAYEVLRHDAHGKPVFLVTTEGTWLKSLCPDCRQKRRKAEDEWVAEQSLRMAEKEKR